MFCNSNVLLRDRGIMFCKINRFIERFFRDGRVKLFFVQLYELAILLFVDAAEPMNNVVGIFSWIVFKLG